MTIQ
jgi:mRNA-degrading endonuclease toxin of MazEF toxin-antitoxin module/antitoxin component of MazEF toxin-antitoxin module